MGVKKYGGSFNSQTRAQAKEQAVFRTKDAGDKVTVKLTKNAFTRLKTLHPNMETVDDILRNARDEVMKTENGSQDGFFIANLTSYNVVTGSQSDFFSPDGVKWTSKRTEDRSGRVDSPSGEGSRADRSINVDKMKPAGSKKVTTLYKNRVSTRK